MVAVNPTGHFSPLPEVKYDLDFLGRWFDARLQNRLAQLTEWKEFTPVWSSTGTAPSLGNGTLTGRYLKFGQLVYARIYWKAGATTTFGTGTYKFSLPGAGLDMVAGAGDPMVGSGVLIDSGTQNYMVVGTISVDTNNLVVYMDGTTAWSNTVPFTAAVNDSLFFGYLYESDF